MIYSQCTADAGSYDSPISIIHDGSPGGFVQFNGNGTVGDNLTDSDFEWKIYLFPKGPDDDPMYIIENEQNPNINVDCSSIDDDDNPVDGGNCLANYTVELTVSCDDGSTSSDTVDISVREVNSPPVACLSTNSDSWEFNEALLIPNTNGIPGEQTIVLLFEYILFTQEDCPQPDGEELDHRSFLWYENADQSTPIDNDDQISPMISKGEGVYQFIHRIKDAYGIYDDENLELVLDEENILPEVSIIAEIDGENIGDGDTYEVIDGQQFNLFGTIEDIYNDDAYARDIVLAWMF